MGRGCPCTRSYGVVARARGSTVGAGGRTLLAGVCLAGDRLRLTPSDEEVRPWLEQLMCRVLEVSRSGFHAWAAREPCRPQARRSCPQTQLAPTQEVPRRPIGQDFSAWRVTFTTTGVELGDHVATPQGGRRWYRHADLRHPSSVPLPTPPNPCSPPQAPRSAAIAPLPAATDAKPHPAHPENPENKPFCSPSRRAAPVRYRQRPAGIEPGQHELWRPARRDAGDSDHGHHGFGGSPG